MEEGIPSLLTFHLHISYFSLPSRHSPVVRGVRDGIRSI